jgi:hypothetical protein
MRNNRFLSSSSSGRTSEGEINVLLMHYWFVIVVVAIDEFKSCSRGGTRIGCYGDCGCCCCVIIVLLLLCYYWVFLLLLLLSLLMILSILSHLHKPLKQQR